MRMTLTKAKEVEKDANNANEGRGRGEKWRQKLTLKKSHCEIRTLVSFAYWHSWKRKLVVFRSLIDTRKGSGSWGRVSRCFTCWWEIKTK